MSSYFWTMQSAIEYSSRGQIEAWIHEFLRQDGNNLALSDGLKLHPRQYLGPLQMDISTLSRCTGPEPNMKYRVEAPHFELRVQKIQAAIAANFDLPPLIVNYSEGQLVVNDGNHRLESIRRMGRTHFGVIVWTTELADMTEFKNKFPECRPMGFPTPPNRYV